MRRYKNYSPIYQLRVGMPVLCEKENKQIICCQSQFSPKEKVNAEPAFMQQMVSPSPPKYLLGSHDLDHRDHIPEAPCIGWADAFYKSASVATTFSAMKIEFTFRPIFPELETDN